MVTAHVAQKARHSAIDGWAKTVGGMAQTLHRGLDRVCAQFTTTMAACNLARIPKLLAA